MEGSECIKRKDRNLIRIQVSMTELVVFKFEQFLRLAQQSVPVGGGVETKVTGEDIETVHSVVKVWARSFK